MGRVDSVRTIAHWLRSYLFWVIVVLIIGFLAFLVFNAFIAKPKIGVMRISDISLDPWDVGNVVKMLKYAEETQEIRALVLEIDCSGGGAVPVEEVYMNVLRVRSKKPVVAYVNLWSLSGGYYVAAASNYIYAKPTSLVGSVGVWMSLPPEREEVSEDVMASGPFKTILPRSDAINWLEMVKESFLRVVIAERGDRLKISKEELSKAAIYLGIEGLRYGLIDDIGSSSDAIEKAAELAGIRGYELVDISKKLGMLAPWYEPLLEAGRGASIEPRTVRPLADRLPMFYYQYEEPK